jgi:hypothetical protein
MKLYRNICLSLCVAFVVILSFVGCSNKSPIVETLSKEAVTQAQLDVKIKKESVKAEFFEIKGHESEYKGRAYFIEGEVSIPGNRDEVLQTFIVTTKEGTGYGMYDVLNSQKVALKEKDKVKVYGKLTGKKNSKGMIQISSNIIEKK